MKCKECGRDVPETAGQEWAKGPECPLEPSGKRPPCGNPANKNCRACIPCLVAAYDQALADMKADKPEPTMTATEWWEKRIVCGDYWERAGVGVIKDFIALNKNKVIQ